MWTRNTLIVGAVWLTFSSIGAASPTEKGGAAPPLQSSLDILSWNVFLRPGLVIHDSQAERAAHMASHLRKNEVIVLSEAFDDGPRRKLVNALESTHPYASKILGADRGIRQDGGVMILSRWPIEAQDSLIYSDCSGTDCWAEKGVNYVVINKGGRRYHIFATHLQAQDASVRAKQLQALANFAYSKPIPAQEPVVFAGDFNVDRGTPEYDSMLSVLHAGCPTPKGHFYTSDPKNDLVPENRPPSFIDYVLYSTRHLQPRESFLEARIFRGRLAGAAQGLRDLSDHYAVLGRLLF